MRTPKKNIHFLDNYLLSPTNPIRVNVIGAGGTGSKFMTALMEINHSLMELDHPGLDVHLWDDDIITASNIGRQRFAESERNLYKSQAIINRLNRWAGTNWKAETRKFERNADGQIPDYASASIYVTCTDTVASRIEINKILQKLTKDYSYHRDKAKYWLDLGNTKFSGQGILSTIGNIDQPTSKKFKTFENLPSIIEEYGTAMQISEQQDDTPSCSLAESLEKQDLFINSTIAHLGASLLWNLLKDGMTENRGFFLNLKNFKSQPITVGS
ncbi:MULTISPECIES: PRTRC system ThiF family protein [Chryseobacterium]|uniref:PRTRC system ThiF family protein n=2 Tax=Chryseobacterium gleum TaxID=250 RepID=A0A3S4NYA9_CHRGE|nr:MULTISPECIES: PRTRC system ThiF family protein [Chryseobacterium]EFK36060.1 PRTRC system ThiF family protein [Chryseobacterium gleum ATCC 35910]QQY31762.1 PRTRC system ThiF family protein [Chryseobacterium gleum]VEE11209.1 PRTRC system ThiF family protein [Chryseobacterium gleum]VFA44014.1 PRTRC system ThiF family protein [Chryseobacterium indologenes]